VAEREGVEAATLSARAVATTAVCRLCGCAEEAPERGGFCFDHGVAYLLWRAQRDELERRELAAFGHEPGDDLSADPALEQAIDLLYELLSRGPFE
jgi:hypothetical protein